MKIRKKPEEIYQEYERGQSFNEAIDLYQNVRKNERFFIGNQWEGLNAPDLPKPVMNILKRVVSYFVAMLSSDDIAVSFTPVNPDAEIFCSVLTNECERVIEKAKIKAKNRDLLRDAAVDGDCCLYLYFDPDVETYQDAKGDIRAEIVENINVYFGNPYIHEVQDQPYLIIAQRKLLEEVKEEAREHGEDWESIQADEDSNQDEKNPDGRMCTVLVKFWRENGTVWCQKSTAKSIVRKAWDTEYRLYPVAWMNWDKVKNCYHGQAAVTGLIPNQLAVNKLYAMAIRSVEMTAFPKIIYDKTKIRRWTNKVGEAIQTVGNPNEAIASSYRAQDMSYQVMDLINTTVSMTRDVMGASDAALGNVKPDNTSAIIAVQQASAIPLELQKLSFYQFVEDYCRIMVDMMRCDFGPRLAKVSIDGEERVLPFDFSQIESAIADMNVDVGASSYWSEIVQTQTADNLFSNQIIDPVLYLESIPSKYIKNKNKIIQALRTNQITPMQTASEVLPNQEAPTAFFNARIADTNRAHQV